MSLVDRSLDDLPRPHACFGPCWCEDEPTDADLERLAEDLSKLPLLEGLQRATERKRESRIGRADTNYRPGGFVR